LAPHASRRHKVCDSVTQCVTLDFLLPFVFNLPRLPPVCSRYNYGDRLGMMGVARWREGGCRRRRRGFFLSEESNSFGLTLAGARSLDRRRRRGFLFLSEESNDSFGLTLAGARSLDRRPRSRRPRHPRRRLHSRNSRTKSSFCSRSGRSFPRPRPTCTRPTSTG